MGPKSGSVDAVVAIRRAAMEKYGGDRTERDCDTPCVERSIGATIQGAYYLSEKGEVNPLHVAALRGGEAARVPEVQDAELGSGEAVGEKSK